LTTTSQTPATGASSPTIREFSTELIVRNRQLVADGVVALELADPQGCDLPKWEPGSHVDLILKDGLVRQYSLCGDPTDGEKWRVAVLLSPDSRGGSRFVHDQLYAGTPVRVRGPRNHFGLVDAPNYVFIAGGIGITPILPMIDAVERSGAGWRLLYAGRSRSTMAFAHDLDHIYKDRVALRPVAESGEFDLTQELSEPAEHTLVYCCGPERLLAAAERATAHWPEGTLHVERFAAKPASDAAAPGPTFEVVCQRSGVTVEVTEDISILEALEDADIPIMSSCLDGICGTCEATVLGGTPDHRDSMLTDAERASGSVILTCVSRSKTERLVLDL
jgi:ferredoxin-NADP reductase